LGVDFYHDDLHVPASHVMLTSRAFGLIALIRPSPVLRLNSSRPSFALVFTPSFRASVYAHSLLYLGRHWPPRY
jgi:membrane-associated phospholipid phosphatase